MQTRMNTGDRRVFCGAAKQDNAHAIQLVIAHIFPALWSRSDKLNVAVVFQPTVHCEKAARSVSDD